MLILNVCIPYGNLLNIEYHCTKPVLSAAELSTGRMDPRVGSGRVGSGRVTILPDFGGSGRVGSALRIY